MKNIPTPKNLTLVSSIALIALTLLCGCKNTSIAEIEDLETVSLYSQTDQLAQTMEYIRGLDRYETSSFRNKVNSGLNRWASSQDEELAPSWKLANVTSSLPEVIKSNPVVTTLNDLKFYSNDAEYIQQVYWLREIADRISNSNNVFHQEYLFQSARNMADQQTLDDWKENPDDLLFDALKLIHPELIQGEDASRVKQLAQTIKVFDWAVRNVNLLEAMEWPTPELIASESMDTNANPADFPPQTATAGPGYTRYTWQILTYGKGDFLERARVFAGLCNQLNIPVAVLATPAATESTRPYEEWLCGAVIGGEMYLFDPLLGLPIHGKNPASIATLSEVMDNPELLSDLNLTIDESVEKLNYRITTDKLNDLIALVVAPPESLSRRMMATESNLTGDIRLKLTIDGDASAEIFDGMKGITSVRLWHAPFSCKLFRDGVAEALITASFDQEVAARLRWLLEQERYIDEFVQFRTARNCFLRGVFRSDRAKDIRSAISYYYAFMYTDEEISLIERDVLLQRTLGILQDMNQSYAEWLSQITFMKQNMALIRADAAFYLSACNFENGMPPTALKWLNRIRNYDDDLRWSEYLPYHVGRANESAGQYEAAARSYGSDKSAQKHGSILRKRWMVRLQQDSETGS